MFFKIWSTRTGSFLRDVSLAPKIKAILFDMDGVLIDAKEWHYEALNKALSLFGMEISRYDQLVTYDGLPTKKKLQMLSRERGLPESLHGFLNALKQKYTQEMIFTKCHPEFCETKDLAGFFGIASEWRELAYVMLFPFLDLLSDAVRCSSNAF